MALDGSQGVWFRRLAALLEPFHGLRYAEFVDYFYGSPIGSRLNLLVNDADEILGVLGHEVVPFDVPGTGEEMLLKKRPALPVTDCGFKKIAPAK